MTQETNVVALRSDSQEIKPLRSGSQEIKQYNPELELKKIVAAEAMEKHFIREIKSQLAADNVLKETMEKLTRSSVNRLIGQANYIVWRDSVVVQSRTSKAGLKKGKNPGVADVQSRSVAQRFSLPDADPGQFAASKWRKKLCKGDRLGGSEPTEVDEGKIQTVIDDVWNRMVSVHNQEKNVRGTEGTGDNEWFTPAEYLDLVRQVFGGEIDLDPASNAKAQKQVQAKKFFTKKDNGLTKDWTGNVFLNPPYIQPDIAHFAAKMIEEVKVERIEQAIMLTHNYTDTEWFQSLAKVADAICFTAGRIKFEGPSGKKAAPTQGQSFMYFGKNVDKFASVFADVGFVVIAWSAE